VDSIRLLKYAAACCIAGSAAVGCGGGSGGSADSTPSISNLQFSPTSALQYDGNGTVTVSGSFDFTDAGKDVSTLHLTSSNGGNESIAINGAAGQSAGSIQGTFQTDTTTLGHYAFQLYVTDTAGLRSNTLASFIAVGDSGSILTSPDAVAWTPQVIPHSVTPALYGVAASSTRLVAVGTQSDPVSSTTTSLILTSNDGVTWTSVPGTIQAALYAVTWSGSHFVAVGSALGQPNAQAIAFVSPDGLTWTTTQISLTGLNVLYDIAWSGARFVAVGLGGAATSADGLAWQATGVGVVGPNNTVGWSGQHFLTCGVVYCELSIDGLQWQDTAQLPRTGPSAYGLAWSGTRWVAVGTNSYVTTSP
jgi:hypothetical protein